VDDDSKVAIETGSRIQRSTHLFSTLEVFMSWLRTEVEKL